MNPELHVTESDHPIQDDLKAYCDGELPWLRRMAVRRHLTSCDACREEVHSMQMLHERLRDVEGAEETLAPALRERILAQIADIPPLPAPRRAPRLVQYGLAASLGMNCLFLFLFNRSGTVAPVNPLPGAVPAPGMSAPAEPRPRQPRTPNEPQANGKSHKIAAVSPQRVSGLPSVKKPEAASVQVMPAAKPPVHPQSEIQAKTMAPAVSDTDGAMPRSAKMSRRVSDQPAPATSPDLAAPGKSPAELPAPPPPAAVVTAAPIVPPPAPPAAPSVPLPRTLTGSGFAASDFTGERDKPLAIDTWPPLSPQLPPTVQADWQIDEQGNVSDIRFTATGSTALDTAIRDAIRRNHYLPAMKGGKPVVARMSHTFVINP